MSVGIAVDIDAVAVNVTIRADTTSTTVPTHDRRDQTPVGTVDSVVVVATVDGTGRLHIPRTTGTVRVRRFVRP